MELAGFSAILTTVFRAIFVDFGGGVCDTRPAG